MLPHVVQLVRLSREPPSDALLAPATAIESQVAQIRLSSGLPPFALAHDVRCRVALEAYLRAARRLTLAARFSREGHPSLAASSRRRGRALLKGGLRLHRSCLIRTRRARNTLIAGVARPPGTIEISGFSASRATPATVRLAAGTILTGSACPAPSDEALGVVVAYSGIAAGTALQAAFGRYPGTGTPLVSAGVALTPGSGTGVAHVAAVGLSAGAADGDYVAVIALNGRPVRAARFSVDCA
jgi:hypothetical protein